MIYSADELRAYDELVADAWQGTTRAGIAGAAVVAALESLAAGGIEWAHHRLEEAKLIGGREMAKRARKQQIPTKRGNIATTAGVLDGMAHVQLSLDLLSLPQIEYALATRDKQLKAASRNARVLRRAVSLMQRHPKATVLRDALLAEGLTLAELVAA